MLLFFNLIKAYCLTLLQLGQEFVFFVISCNFVKSIKEEFSARGFKDCLFTFEKDTLRLHLSFSHLRCKKTVIDETIEFKFIRREEVCCSFWVKLYYCRTNSLMGLLCPFCLGCIVLWLGGKVFVTIMCFDVLSYLLYGFFGKMQTVGSHIGNYP